MTRTNPTSVGRLSSKGRICLRLDLLESFLACAAALITDRVLRNGDVVGEGDLKILIAVEWATPGYLSVKRSIAYLFRRNILACVWKCLSLSLSVGTSSNSR